MDIMAIVKKPVPLYAAVLGVAGGTAGAFFFLQHRFGKEFDTRLRKEIEGIRIYYGAEKPYTTPTEAVEVLRPEIDNQLELIQTLKYDRESEKPEKVEIVKNVFTDADDLGGFDAEEEMAARDAGMPHVLLHDEFYESDLPPVTLEYYDEDNVLCDEKGTPITDVDNLVGDALLKFGQGSRDPNVVYVHNPELDSNFEVVRKEGRFDEIVLGLKHSEPSMLRRHRPEDW